MRNIKRSGSNTRCGTSRRIKVLRPLKSIRHGTISCSVSNVASRADRQAYSSLPDGQISVSADDILRIGQNLTSVQYPESAGGGYLATAMGTHSIHCLHYIWQDHYVDVSPEIQSLKAEIPEMYERHYEHCVDYIRQYLMCKFDTTIMPFNWVLDHQNPTPNGNTIHKCVNWDSLQDWLKGKTVQMPEGFKWKQPADAVRLDWNP